MNTQARDYSLTAQNSTRALENGLAEANWYTTDVPREQLKTLLTRSDWPAVRDTTLWFGLLIGSGVAGALLWGSWWAVFPFALYGVIYASSSDSRWHESLHGTAFKTDWLNNALYEVASFMVFRESIPWRWSHMRHHSDTLIRGRDPEIAAQRPPDYLRLFLSFVGLSAMPAEFKKMCMHAAGRLNEAEATYVPDYEKQRVFLWARVYLLIYLTVIATAILTQSILPLMFVGLPTLYGSWLLPIYGYTQHAGLAEDVLDHRLNCRTVYMNRVNRFFYWNMNYHQEHHMFPLVPYHALPQLHEVIKHDLSKPYAGILAAYRDIIPAIRKQREDLDYCIQQVLPEASSQRSRSGDTAMVIKTKADSEGWLEVCKVTKLASGDIVRVDHGRKTYAVYSTGNGEYFATDGICTHGNTHLVGGLIVGQQIECPKHNGRFSLLDGSPQRAPVCVALSTYPIRLNQDRLFLNINPVRQPGDTPSPIHDFNVVSNKNVATFIKELVLEPIKAQTKLDYQAGDYIQLNIPPYRKIDFANMQIEPPFDLAWQRYSTYSLFAESKLQARRNYSMATNPAIDKQLKFNVRIATPPSDMTCSAGVGSSYVFNLKPGDKVSAIGPFGDFRIQDTEREMVYIGGGAGMAPLRSHISYLLESLGSKRTISFWYGARSVQELYYTEYFDKLASEHENFQFHIVLSDPQTDEEWSGHTGFIHELVDEHFLASHSAPTANEYYLCGPPPMLAATMDMLDAYGVSKSDIRFDEF